MNQAKIYWDRENYVQVEKLFRQSAELCGDADVWRLNVAHTLFMQENKFREATSFYEPLVKQNYDNVCYFYGKMLYHLDESHMFSYRSWTSVPWYLPIYAFAILSRHKTKKLKNFLGN